MNKAAMSILYVHLADISTYFYVCIQNWNWGCRFHDELALVGAVANILPLCHTGVHFPLVDCLLLIIVLFFPLQILL